MNQLSYRSFETHNFRVPLLWYKPSLYAQAAADLIRLPYEEEGHWELMQDEM